MIVEISPKIKISTILGRAGGGDVFTVDNYKGGRGLTFIPPTPPFSIYLVMTLLAPRSPRVLSELRISAGK